MDHFNVLRESKSQLPNATDDILWLLKEQPWTPNTIPQSVWGLSKFFFQNKTPRITTWRRHTKESAGCLRSPYHSSADNQKPGETSNHIFSLDFFVEAKFLKISKLLARRQKKKQIQGLCSKVEDPIEIKM